MRRGGEGGCGSAWGAMVWGMGICSGSSMREGTCWQECSLQHQASADPTHSSLPPTPLHTCGGTGCMCPCAMLCACCCMMAACCPRLGAGLLLRPALGRDSSRGTLVGRAAGAFSGPRQW